MHPLLALAFAGLALFAVYYIRRAPKAQRPRLMLLAGGALLVLLAMAGKLSPLVAALGAAVAAGSRIMGLMQNFSGLQGLRDQFSGGGAKPAGPPPADMQTAWLSVRFERDTGRMTGRVLRGKYSGRQLGALENSALASLHQELAAADVQSAQLLETFLARELGADWSARLGVAPCSAPPATQDHGAMTDKEARRVLGVSIGADRDAVVTAHRRLMQKLHPDRGGSDFLAAKVNDAKKVLLARLDEQR